MRITYFLQTDQSDPSLDTEKKREKEKQCHLRLTNIKKNPPTPNVNYLVHFPGGFSCFPMRRSRFKYCGSNNIKGPPVFLKNAISFPSVRLCDWPCAHVCVRACVRFFSSSRFFPVCSSIDLSRVLTDWCAHEPRVASRDAHMARA